VKKDIQDLLEITISTITKTNISIEVLRTKSEVHGDWTTNVAMILAKELKKILVI
jgi:arginyl-tRNA synthetase